MVKYRMSRSTRASVLLALLSTLVSLLVIAAPRTASAESIPPLQWSSAVVAKPVYARTVTSPSGEVTVGCNSYGGGSQDLVTYNSSGAVVRQISRTSQIDGVTNCISNVIVDKNNMIYGRPWGQTSSGSWTYGPNLLAYDGNTLKWKYPVACENGGSAQYAVGANGNIYATTRTSSDGVHLIGLAPELQAGQTQPTKVLDIKVPNDCSMMLRPYRDGIVLHGQSSSGAKYYSYAGKFLGTTVGDVWYEKVNAEGRLFTATYVQGSYTSASVSAYDPRTGAITWTTSASTSGANVQGATVYPLSGGGVVALIREQKMISGLPASPVEYVSTLVILNANGQIIKSAQLPNKSGQDTYGNTTVLPDSSGRIALVRDLDIKTTVSYPATVPAVVVAILDANGEQVAGEGGILSGNANAAAGPLYGYTMDYAGGNGPVNGLGTLFVNARCIGTCGSNTDTKMYPLRVTGFQMDYPRGVVLNANTGAQPVPRSYMALGDSFSAGEGVEPFVDATACHRSALAYSRVNGLNPNTTLQLDKFVACSGALTTHILNGWNDGSHNEPSQVSALSSGSPKVVTITIGGNDVFFADFAKACILDTCNFSSSVYNNSVNAINNTLGGNLTTTYKKLLEVTQTSGARIFVLGYPQVIADKTVNDPGDARCFYMYESVPVASGRYWEDARAARDIVTKLNAKISDTVNAVRALSTDNQRLTFVTATTAGSSFEGHEVCASGESYFQNLDQAANNTAYVFHPNAQGQAAYAQLVRQVNGE